MPSTEQGNGSGPSAQEVCAALDVLLSFLKNQRPDFLTEMERGLVTDTKHLVWLAGQQDAASTSTSPTSAALQSSVPSNDNLAQGSDLGPIQGGEMLPPQTS